MKVTDYKSFEDFVDGESSITESKETGNFAIQHENGRWVSRDFNVGSFERAAKFATKEEAQKFMDDDGTNWEHYTIVDLTEGKELKEADIPREEVSSIIVEYFNNAMSDDFYDLVRKTVDCVDDYSNEDDIRSCIDNAYIYSDDKWTIFKHYFASPEDADWNVASEQFYTDVYSICSKIANSDFVESITEDADKEDKTKFCIVGVKEDGSRLYYVDKGVWDTDPAKAKTWNDQMEARHEWAFVVKEEKGFKRIFVPVFDGKDLNEKKCLTESDDINPLDGIVRQPVFETEDGDILGIEYADGKLYAGSITNVGIMHTYEMFYDDDLSIDANLQKFNDQIEEEKLNDSDNITFVDNREGAITNGDDDNGFDEYDIEESFKQFVAKKLESYKTMDRKDLIKEYREFRHSTHDEDKPIIEALRAEIHNINRK